jgi:hypothetical protein
MTAPTAFDLFNEQVCDLKDGPLKQYNEIRAMGAEDLISRILPAHQDTKDPCDFNGWVRAQIRAAYADGLTLAERAHIWSSFVPHRNQWVCNFLLNLRPKILGYTAEVYYPDPEKLSNWFAPNPPKPPKTTPKEPTQ